MGVGAEKSIPFWVHSSPSYCIGFTEFRSGRRSLGLEGRLPPITTPEGSTTTPGDKTGVHHRTQCQTMGTRSVRCSSWCPTGNDEDFSGRWSTGRLRESDRPPPVKTTVKTEVRYPLCPGSPQTHPKGVKSEDRRRTWTSGRVEVCVERPSSTPKEEGTTPTTCGQVDTGDIQNPFQLSLLEISERVGTGKKKR